MIYFSSADDVYNALPYAYTLKLNGDSVIVIGIGPNTNSTILAPLASGSNFLFSSNDYSSLPTNAALATQLNAAICATPPPTSPAPSTTVPTTSPAATTSTPSPTGPTGDPCRRDIIVLMDSSNGLGTLANFQAASLQPIKTCLFVYLA